MEAHQLAIAALNKVAHSSRDSTAGKIASSRSTPDASGADIEVIHDHSANAEESFQQSRGIAAMSSAFAGSPEFLNSTALGLQSISSDNSQATADGHDGHDGSTPPTSDGFSSQSTNQELQMLQLSQLSQLAAAAAQPMANTFASRPNLSIAPTAGHKRTADGQVKPMLFKSPTSPHGSKSRGHSRNTSAVSAASTASSKIGELSSELRTRLSYAMVKVNNGWQSNSIDEVESMASQAGSPTSSTSTLHGRRNLVTSPREAIASIQTASIASGSMISAPVQDFDLYSRNDPSSQTYESFWRNHTSNPLPTQRSSQTSSQKLSLAPPADIRSVASTRRCNTPKFSKPPTIPGQGSNSSLHTSAPRTPNGRAEIIENKSIQTPTQKTIQEQDAMEALLFMSSPNNSGNMKHAFPPPARNHMSPQQSPLRAEFNVQPPINRGVHGRRVEFEKASTSTDPSEAVGYQGKAKSSGNRNARSDAIDRLLDEMGDSSSDEEELVLNYSSPRRVAAGKV